MLRRAAVGLALAVTLVAPSAASSAAVSGRELALVRAINAARAAHGLAPVRPERRLQRAARAHSAVMLRTGSFFHGSFVHRLAAFGIRARAAGENLAWGVGSRAQARAVVRSWLLSPPHRANLLRPGFRRVGVGALVGPFSGYARATVVTAVFVGR